MGVGRARINQVDTKVHGAAIAVFNRVQATGEPVTIALCRDLVSETGSTADPARVMAVVNQWNAEITSNRRRGGRR
jgi:hypothetical protein